MKTRIVLAIAAALCWGGMRAEARSYLFSVNSSRTDAIRVWCNNTTYGNFGTRGSRATGWFVLNVDPYYSGQKRVEWLSLDVRNLDRMTFELVYSGYISQNYIAPYSGDGKGLKVDLLGCSLDGGMPLSSSNTWRAIDNLGRQHQQVHLSAQIDFVTNPGQIHYYNEYYSPGPGARGVPVSISSWDGDFPLFPSQPGQQIQARLFEPAQDELALSFPGLVGQIHGGEGCFPAYLEINLEGNTLTAQTEPSLFSVLDSARTSWDSINDVWSYDFSFTINDSGDLTWYPTLYLSNTVRRYAFYEGGATVDVGNWGRVLWQGLDQQSIGARIYRSGDVPPGYTNATTTWGSASYAFTIPGTWLGTYQLQMAYAGNTYYESGSQIIGITVYNNPAVGYAGDTIGMTGGLLNVSARLVDAGGGSLAGQWVTWSLDTGMGVTTVSAQTDSYGWAYSALTLPMAEDTYTLNTAFSGEGFYLADAETILIEVVPEPASVALMAAGLALAHMLRKRSGSRAK